MACVRTLLPCCADGGCTAFPLLDVAVAPACGSALLWMNLDRKGRPDPRTLHAGEPVTRGEKWGMNVWLRQRPHGAVANPDAWRPAPAPPLTAATPAQVSAATLQERAA